MQMIEWHPNAGAQSQFCRDETSRFPAYVSGFRGGKTWSGARKVLMLAGINKTPGLLIAETYQQARQVMVPEIARAADECGIESRWMPSEQIIILGIRDPMATTYGRRVVLYLRSADKAERIAGFEVGYVWGDEVGRWPYRPHEPMFDPWTQAIARMSDKRATIPQAIVTGTHEGHGTRLYDEWEASPKPGHKLYRGSTRDNKRHLETGYIRSLEESYDPTLLEQYLEGRAVDLGVGLAYYAFGDHNKAPTVYDPNRPLWWSLDFNVAPMCSIVAQPQGNPGQRGHSPQDALHVIDEIALVSSANTADLAMQFADRYENHKGHVVVFGDATGGHMDTRSRTDDWRLVAGILRRTFGDRFTLSVPKANPPVRQRVARVNAVCRDGTGRVRLVLDPIKSPRIARDLERVRWKDADHIDKRDQSITHASDALGYLVHVAYPPSVQTIGGGAEGSMTSHEDISQPIDWGITP